VATEVAVPPHWEVTTMMAVGRAAPSIAAGAAVTDRFPPQRQRKATDELLW
jgi:hypothetical protein